MKFCDNARIFVASGNGGAGCVSFRREKNIPFGGPDGGNGGKGGDVFLVTDPHLVTLIDFRYRPHYKAPSGDNGHGRLKQGAGGEDIRLRVPMGTEIWFEERCVADLVDLDQSIMVAQGGLGGRGNASFATSTNRTPRESTPGTLGQSLWIELRLKLLAHWGFIGLPNAGKSTLLRALTNAKSKVGDYPFTTLIPQLGTFYDTAGVPWVMADLPGLIQDAHKGKGLGHRFLAHGERCQGIFHLIDATSDDPARDYTIIHKEVVTYNPMYASKPEVVLLTKADLLTSQDREKVLRTMQDVLGPQGRSVFLISSHDGLEKAQVERWCQSARASC